jgi:hypothetical protein
MTEYHLTLDYAATDTNTFELPEGRVWADVSIYYVKWNHIYITFKDGVQEDIDLVIEPNVDTKRPISIEVTDGDYNPV